MATVTPIANTNHYHAIWAFQGEAEGDLSFQAGDTIIVTSKNDPEWWEGYVSTDSSYIGSFPSTYVSSLPSTVSSSSSSSTSGTMHATDDADGNDTVITTVIVPEAERTFIIPYQYRSYQSHHPILQLRTLYRIDYTTVTKTESSPSRSPQHHSTYIRFSDLRTFASFLYTEMDNLSIPKSTIEDTYTLPFDTLLQSSENLDTRKRTSTTIEHRRLRCQEFLQRLIHITTGASSSVLSSLLLSFLSHTDHAKHTTNDQPESNPDDYFYMKLSTDDITTYMESITSPTITTAGVVEYTSSDAFSTVPSQADNATESDDLDTVPVPEPILTLDTSTFTPGTRIPFTIEDLDAFDYLLEHGFTILNDQHQFSAPQRTNGTRSGQTVTAHWTMGIWDGAIDTAIETEKINQAIFTIGDYRYPETLPPGLHKAFESSCITSNGNKLYTIILSPALGYGEEGKLPLIPKNIHLVYRITVDRIDGEGRRMKRYQPEENVSNGKSQSTMNKFVIDSYHPVDDQLLSKGAAAMGITMNTASTPSSVTPSSIPILPFSSSSSSSTSSSLTAHLGINSSTKPRPSPEEAEKAFRAYLESIGSPLPPDYQPVGRKTKGSSSGRSIFRRAFTGTTTVNSSLPSSTNGKAPPPAPPPKRRSKDSNSTTQQSSSSSTGTDTSISPAAGIPYSSSSTNNSNGLFSRIFPK